MYSIKQALYVVGIPIGNIFDFSQKALFVLKNVDFILVEDTRKAEFLLKNININTKIVSLHIYNEFKVNNIVLSKIIKGMSIALISDAGTPLISDPGFSLVKLIHENELQVIPIPGPCSIISALSVSGFNICKFVFEGFLPKNEFSKKQILKNLLNESRIIVLFESPKRLLSTLCLMKDLWKVNKKLILAKDLTKKFEHLVYTDLFNVIKDIKKKCFYSNGEIIIILGQNIK